MEFNKLDIWDENYYNNPRLTDEMIDFAEKSFNVKFPKLYLDFLKIQNGGYIINGLFYPLDDDYIEFRELYGIVIDNSIETSHNILDTEYLINEWNLPRDIVIISGDGHCWVVLDYRKSISPTISWIDSEFDKDIHLADSFKGFIERLELIQDFKDD